MSRRVGSARAANTRESRSSVTTHLLLIVSNRLVDNDCTLVSTCRQPSGCPGVTGRTHDQPEHLMVPAHRDRTGAGAGGPGPPVPNATRPSAATSPTRPTREDQIQPRSSPQHARKATSRSGGGFSGVLLEGLLSGDARSTVLVSL